MQKKDKKRQAPTPITPYLEAEHPMDAIDADGSKVNILIKKFANAMKDAGIPNCIMAWDAEKSRYVYAGAMPEEIGDGTQFSSKKLTRFVRFLEICTDFDKDNYMFNL